MFKPLFYSTILSILFFSCKNDDDKIKYLSSEEQKIVDREGIDFLLKNYYLSEQGEVIRCKGNCTSEKTKTPLKDILNPICEGRAYYALLKDKEGTGTSPNPEKDTILINFGITYFRTHKSSTDTGAKSKISIAQLGKIGNIYSGTESVKNPAFYHYNFLKYVNERYPNREYDRFNLNERNRIKKKYEDNNIYGRNVIHEFVEGIQKFKSREATINSPVEIQGIIVAPSANSKGLEYYLSLGSAVPKDCILVFTVDLLFVKKEKNDK